jgi:D-alanyl-lipoteichoic acid acyltransferase DltB (MBOAT superfamily)
MLFNSVPFLVYFLPVTVVGFYLLGAARLHKLQIVWLTLSSLFFYGWWNVTSVPLLVGSVLVNFAIGRALSLKRRKWLLIAGVAANLALLGYYKYSDFFIGALNQSLGTRLPLPEVVLPLAISFFTFQQIAYLTDAHDGLADEPSLNTYAMFVTFFPHLIAGPITYHREMLPQFENLRMSRPRADLLALGLTVFVVGLFKKVLIADSLSQWASPVFAAADAGHAMTALEAWGGSLCYTLQIYFDFSGYTDMAIGLGLMFGIRLPQNFDSPYKSHNIIEFWSRWNMTLTRFLTSYVYTPMTLSLSRARRRAGKPMPRRGRTTPGAFASLVALPTMVTMFLIGMWHGAGWQFMIFGLLHGTYITINHAWRSVKAQLGRTVDSPRLRHRIPAVLLTFLCVLVALVFFRAGSTLAALRLLSAMLASHGLYFPGGSPTHSALALATLFGARALPAVQLSLADHNEFRLLFVLFGILWLLPNTQQWLRNYETGLNPLGKPTWLEQRTPHLARLLVWRPSPGFAILVGGIAFLAIARALSVAPTEFLYFKF